MWIWVGRQELEGAEKGKTVIRIYSVKKSISNRKNNYILKEPDTNVGKFEEAH